VFLTKRSRALIEKLIVAELIKQFPVSHGSLPCSQEPATGPCPETVASSSHTFIPFPKIHLNIVLPSVPRFSEGSLPFGISNRNVMLHFSASHACYMLSPSHRS
jgi:hypothetical protein